MVVLKLTSLPNECICHIFTFLSYKDLIRCSLVCQRFNAMTKDDALWKIQATRQFLLKKNHVSTTWKEIFQEYYKIFKDEVEVYPAIRHAWNQMETYIEKYMPMEFESLKGPVSDEDLLYAERKLKRRFPADIRCSMKIHNGQTPQPGPGLFGLAMLSDYIISEKLLDCRAIADTKDEIDGCVRLTECFASSTCRYLSLTESSGYPENQIFCPSNDTTDLTKSDNFIIANSFSEVFCKFTQELEDEIYYKWPHYGNPLIFKQDEDCIAVTDDIFTVTVGTYFMAQHSTVSPPMFLFAYRINMSMKSDASSSKSCKLKTRHWIITDENGSEERVDGPGVIGEYPVMEPGRTYSWTSCTSFKTTYGNMTGHFIMRGLENGDNIRIDCPCFHMKCLPYETYEQRKERKLRLKKNL